MSKEKPAPITGLFRENVDMKKLPAVEIDNTVIWVNPEIETPFKIEEGKPSKLGLFLTPEDAAKLENKFELGIALSHRRSAVLGRVVFKDKEGRMYRDVDLKGMGVISNKVEVSHVRPKNDKFEPDEAYGILKIASAYHDKTMSEDWLKAGIRTHRVVAIISPKEIVAEDGRKVSIEEAKARGTIPSQVKPVIEVRAFGTKYRLDDIVHEFPYHYDAVDKEISEALLKSEKPILRDAIAMVAQELGKDPEQFTENEYLIWLMKTLGQQVARMHKNGWHHDYLTTHNITLDGRITDLDSVGWLKNLSPEQRDLKRWGDLHDLIATLDIFLRNSELLETLQAKEGQVEKLFKILKTAYDEEVGIPGEFNRLSYHIG